MPPASTVVVRLTDEQRHALDRLLRTGSHPAALRRRAAILLRADAAGPDGWTDDGIADHLDTSRNTVLRVRPQFAADGRDATRHRKTPTGRPHRTPDGGQEAQLVARACSKAPDGRGRGTMRRLADRLVELAAVESIDPATAWRGLQRATSRRGPSRSGSSRRRPAGRSARAWRACSTRTPSRTTRAGRSCAWTRAGRN